MTYQDTFIKAGTALARTFSVADPTRYDLLREAVEWCHENRNLHEFERDAVRFSIESAIYWFATHWHGGQWSNLYSVLSTSKYKPGLRECGVDEDEDFIGYELYNHFEDVFTR